jgi:Spy/CpxP family protein refolding chaperone
MFWSKRRFWRGATLGAVVALAATGCHRGHHDGSESEMRERAHDVATLVLEHVDASTEQAARIEQILDPLVPDLVALRPERQALMAELQGVLGAADVDPVRVEELRKKALALAERASARGAKALVEAAQVLDQEQRAKLIRHWQRRHGA